MKNFLRYWLPLMAYVGVILGLSLFVRTSLPTQLLRWDKLIHALEYAVFALLAVRAVRSGRRLPWWRAGGGAILLATLLASLDEGLQHMNPSRTADFLDALADLSGALLAVIVYLLIVDRWQKETVAPDSQAGGSSSST